MDRNLFLGCDSSLNQKNRWLNVIETMERSELHYLKWDPNLIKEKKECLLCSVYLLISYIFFSLFCDNVVSGDFFFKFIVNYFDYRI